MEKTELTPQQRENLKNQLLRRIGKMDDAALLQLELVTRRPLDRPHPPAESVLKVEPEKAAAPPIVEANVGETGVSEAATAADKDAHPAADANMNRRQAITLGVTGILGLIAASTGIGLGKSRRETAALRAEGEEQAAQAEDVREELQRKLDDLTLQFSSLRDDEFDASLRYTLNLIKSELGELTALSDSLVEKRDASAAVIDSYQADLLPNAQKSVARLQELTNHVQDLKNVPYVEEAKEVFFFMLDHRDLKSYFDFFKAYQTQIPALAEYIDFIPSLLQANLEAVAALSPWLATETGIDAQLLQPLENDMFHAFDAANRQAKSVQQLAEGKLTTTVEQFLEKRDQFYSALDEQN